VLFFATDVSLRRALEMAETVKLVAESAVNSKTQTISFLCHEIRNPLNGIMCATALMSLEKDRMEPLHQVPLTLTLPLTLGFGLRLRLGSRGVRRMRVGLVEVSSTSTASFRPVRQRSGPNPALTLNPEP